MAKKKINKELRQTLESQFEIEGFDYAVVEKGIGPDNWDEGVFPDDLKDAWNGYLEARKKLRSVLEEYNVDPF